MKAVLLTTYNCTPYTVQAIRNDIVIEVQKFYNFGNYMGRFVKEKSF